MSGKVITIEIRDEAAIRPVRHGKWVNENGEPIGDSYSVYCSECERWSEYRTSYCPHCGSKIGVKE